MPTLDKTPRYPTIHVKAELPPATLYCSGLTYGARSSARHVLVVPAKMLLEAGLADASHLYVGHLGDRVLVTAWKGWGQRRNLAKTAQRGAVVQLAASRLATALVDAPVLVAGPGYVMVVPESATSDYEHLPFLGKAAGSLIDDNIESLAERLPARQGMFWRATRASNYGRAVRCIDVNGNVWAAAGFVANDPIRVTRYADGVYVERVTEAAANSRLRFKTVRNKGSYGTKRFGRAVLEPIAGETIRIVAMDGALALIGADRPLSDFGLTAEDLKLYDTPARPVAAESPAEAA